MDFGAETLNMFRDAPQVGEVLLADEEEKITNLFKFLDRTIEERKKLFVEYNGSYESYCKNSGQTVPRILVIINNYVTYKEIFDKQEEKFSKLVREGFKYGIIFVITSTNPNLGYRLEQNFIKNMTLQLNNQDDYYSVFGRTGGVFPSNTFGRGLVKRGGIFEYQTAMICENDKISEEIKKVNGVLSTKYRQLKKEKEFPKISFDEIDFDKNTIIGAHNIKEHKEFINQIINKITENENALIQVFDEEEIIEKGKVVIYNGMPEEKVNKIKELIKNINLIELKSKIDSTVKQFSKQIYLIFTDLDKFRNFVDNDNSLLINLKRTQGVTVILITNNNDIKDIVDTCEQVMWIGDGVTTQQIFKIDKNAKEGNYFLNLNNNEIFEV